MPKLRRLSGDEVIKLLAQCGFRVHAQRGSHVKLLRVAPTGERQILTIPRHRELDRGTLHAIFRQASRFVPSDAIHPHFYSE
jgi:predicted RNA binding protein YcfA (HicA-like mRNA interferase family)